MAGKPLILIWASVFGCGHQSGVHYTRRVLDLPAEGKKERGTEKGKRRRDRDENLRGNDKINIYSVTRLSQGLRLFFLFFLAYVVPPFFLFLPPLPALFCFFFRQQRDDARPFSASINVQSAPGTGFTVTRTAFFVARP